MSLRKKLRTFLTWNASLVLAVVMSACLTTQIASAGRGHGNNRTLSGVVEGVGHPQPGYSVSLYASYAGHRNRKHSNRLLGTDTTDKAGRFKIRYKG